MTKNPNDELRELLIGTWTGVAILAEMMIHSGAIQREDLLCFLRDAENLAKDRRSLALSGMIQLIVKLEGLAGCTDDGLATDQSC